MMRESTPNTWQYGGIIDTIEWDAQPATVRQFYGEPERVRRGDHIRVLHTGSGMHFVDVARA